VRFAAENTIESQNGPSTPPSGDSDDEDEEPLIKASDNAFSRSRTLSSKIEEKPFSSTSPERSQKSSTPPNTNKSLHNSFRSPNNSSNQQNSNSNQQPFSPRSGNSFPSSMSSSPTSRTLPPPHPSLPPNPSLPPKPQSRGPAPSSSQRPLSSQSSNARPSGGSTSGSKVEPPAWVRECEQQLKHQYPSDKFEIIARPNVPGEWRLRCNDCPGKLYTAGPNETLDNFIGENFLQD
jgi:SWI/SNF-related matrix-associated actin-dependent regulator of chromatin subfamily B member 1